MYQYILFDLDGTLTDPKIGITTCVQYALHKMGIEEPDPDRLEPFIGPPLIDSFREFYGMNEEEAVRAVEYYRERFSTVGLFENEVYSGIPELLARLKKDGRKLAIASSKPTVYVKKILEYFSIYEYFDIIVGSELDGTRCRKEEVVEEALEQLSADDKFRKRDAVMIGDRKFDIEGAKAHQIPSIGVNYGYAADNELVEAGADCVVGNVKELSEVLLKDDRR
ncbi:MAG: HAD family hydrolase [Lachnospiraceae bacterium]|nr:HAD family hydrolase [Lachnospiraceae bacterium]MDD6629251.1 HAD family hydrolase [Lachnospiraceae bacterium]